MRLRLALGLMAIGASLVRADCEHFKWPARAGARLVRRRAGAS